jgi:putative membrane protein
MVRTNIIPTIAAVFSAGNGGIIGLYVALAIVTVGIVVAVIRYFTYRYEIGTDELVIHQGLFGRLHRTIPFQRIQNIDLSQNVFHRLLKVAEVRIETGSGTDADAVMRVLSISQYHALKNALAENRTHSIAAVPIAESIESVVPDSLSPVNTELVLALPTRLVMLAGFLSNRGEVVAGVLIGVLWQARFSDSWLSWDRLGSRTPGGKESIRDAARAMATDGGMIRKTLVSIQQTYGLWGTVLICLLFVVCLWLLFRTFSSLWYLFKFYNYRLERHGNSLHVHCGLFTKISATIPLGRVQLISVQRSLMARWFGLASIRIETAGGGKDASENAANSVGRKWFVPVLWNADVPRILEAIDARIKLEDSHQWHGPSVKAATRMMRPVYVLAAIAMCVGAFFQPLWGWLIPLPLVAIAWLMIRKKSKSRRYKRTPWGVVYRSGLIRQKCSMTLLEKIQSVQISQSPFDRRWTMSSLSLDTAAAGPADHRIQVEFLDEQFAQSEWKAIQSTMPVCHLIQNSMQATPAPIAGR